jgi:hypothetical protein
MNNVAILPKTIMYLLQNQNVKREVAKKVQTTPSMSVPVVADANAPPTASEPVSQETTSREVKASDAADGTSIADLLNATPPA